MFICIFVRTNMRHGSLFSGIGGFDLASEWMGWENVFHCEWNEFGKKVLHHYWPNAESFDDITKTDFTKYANTIDILTGGFPCQPYSQAGQRKGKEDERHLWPQMLRAIQEIKPKYIVGENVFGLLNWNGGMVFDEVHSDLESAGYEVQAVVIPAAAVNAPHGRDRVWFVAVNTKSSRSTEVGGICEGSDNESIGICAKNGIIANTNGIGNRGKSKQSSAAHKQGRCGETNTGIGNEGEQQFIRDIASEGIDSNTDSVRLQHTEEARNIQEGTRTAQSKRGKSAKSIKTNGSNGDVTDTHGIGFQRKGGSTELEGRRFGFNNPQNNKTTWDNFPTQSPICGGDDGLPTELDGITFSKWRNESIKAYGNAIVPQVAYEIFKAIEMTNGN